MRTTVSALIFAAIAMTSAPSAFAKPAGPRSAEADVWRSYADRIPIGSTVTIRTSAGERITAVLYVVDDTGITFKPKTRLPEPARRLTFDQIAAVSPRSDRVNIGKYIAIGAAIGAISGGGKGAVIGGATGAGAGAGVEAVRKGEQVRVDSETRLDFRLENSLDVTLQSPSSTPQRTNPSGPVRFGTRQH